MENIDIAGYASITAICFVIGAGIKASKLNDKFIPVIMGACGAALGLWATLAGVPDFASNVLDGIARGVVSGFAATGIHQIWKQLAAGDTSNTSDTEPTDTNDEG